MVSERSISSGMGSLSMSRLPAAYRHRSNRTTFRRRQTTQSNYQTELNTDANVVNTTRLSNERDSTRSEQTTHRGSALIDEEGPRPRGINHPITQQKLSVRITRSNRSAPIRTRTIRSNPASTSGVMEPHSKPWKGGTVETFIHFSSRDNHERGSRYQAGHAIRSKGCCRDPRSPYRRSIATRDKQKSRTSIGQPIRRRRVARGRVRNDAPSAAAGADTSRARRRQAESQESRSRKYNNMKAYNIVNIRGNLNVEKVQEYEDPLNVEIQS